MADDTNDATAQDPAAQEPAAQEPAAHAAPDSAAPAFPDIDALGYEEARDELVGIVARLEAGQAPLEDSMHLWRRGEALAAHCARWLEGARAEIEHATGQAAGAGDS